MDVVIELYDTSGRQLWRHAESGVPASEVYTVKWDLSVDGAPLGTGVYLYRVKVASGWQQLYLQNQETHHYQIKNIFTMAIKKIYKIFASWYALALMASEVKEQDKKTSSIL